MSTGIDRFTGRPLSDWPHVVQSILVILKTRIGDRVMRRSFGSAVPGLLGRNLVPTTLLRFYTAIAIAIELWEPRFADDARHVAIVSGEQAHDRRHVDGGRTEIISG